MWSNSNIGLQEKGLRISLIAVDWAREVIANTQWAELSYNATVADGFIIIIIFFSCALHLLRTSRDRKSYDSQTMNTYSRTPVTRSN